MKYNSPEMQLFLAVESDIITASPCDLGDGRLYFSDDGAQGFDGNYIFKP